MRGSLTTLAFLLLIVAALRSEANEVMDRGTHHRCSQRASVWKLCTESAQLKPTACCFAYVGKKVPLRSVTDYYRTHDQCSSPGIVFRTRMRRQICAHPSDAWVQEYVRYLDNKTGASMA
ncbi:C-C motif chemokine 3-like isoform X1 [Suricata suricatta]|uniref:C-C motif chemokine 3-like isoform X1 n=1 Tax=Suricata suricatta TaxID=37032 RepID=UPI001155ECAB|nr:C-C motif chemokine 3-like isoform X1 [Suricata suricatta]